MIPNMQEGKCFYIEKTRLTFDKAIENGQEKLKNYGGGILYEPYSIVQQKRVVDMALEHGLKDWLHWIGVTDVVNEGQSVYIQLQQPAN